ncbi:hypothetical protein MNV_2140002 [Candidatus Methanoperedens nitroreducens]|uniref:Uncharacterized protein n=1 Tax=Candidatus Methanoperedens nitratireducens TaxID=1392998 RepID=A0A284VP59_9EURY|nr:hypothetical protein MNV_2140002 [Candidatus Methanoperedens nitroreducens]
MSNAPLVGVTVSIVGAALTTGTNAILTSIIVMSSAPNCIPLFLIFYFLL